MNPFLRHGVDHLSASSLNCWRAAPALWAIRYLLRVKDQGSPAMWRGTAVEGGLEAILRGKGLDEAKATALFNFDANAQGDVSDDTTAERDSIAAYLDVLSAPTLPKNLIATQLRIELWLDDVPIPLVGYVDFVFEDCLFDLKATTRIPSEPRPDHARQVSIYMKARNQPGSLLYVSPKRYETYTITDPDVHIAALRRDALSLMRFLDKFGTARDAALALPQDTDGFMWGETSKAKALELWT
jgi:hypothetical protein